MRGRRWRKVIDKMIIKEMIKMTRMLGMRLYLHGSLKGLASQLEFIISVENPQLHESYHGCLFYTRMRLPSL